GRSCQRPAGVPGAYRGVGFEQAAEPLAAAPVGGGDRLVEGGDGARGHLGRAAAAVSVAESHYRLADGQRRGVRERECMQVRNSVDLNESNVIGRVDADDAGGISLAAAW